MSIHFLFLVFVGRCTKARRRLYSCSTFVTFAGSCAWSFKWMQPCTGQLANLTDASYAADDYLGEDDLQARLWLSLSSSWLSLSTCGENRPGRRKPGDRCLKHRYQVLTRKHIGAKGNAFMLIGRFESDSSYAGLVLVGHVGGWARRQPVTLSRCASDQRRRSHQTKGSSETKRLLMSGIQVLRSRSLIQASANSPLTYLKHLPLQLLQ